MSPRLGLQVDLRIPVAVIHNDGIGRLEVEANAPGAEAEQEREDAAVGCVEGGDEVAAVGGGGGAVHAQELPSTPFQVVCDHVQCARHAAENQHLQ